MTDKNTELPQNKQPETASATSNATSRPEPAARPASQAGKAATKRRGLAGMVLIVVVVVALVLAAALWYQQQQFTAFSTQLRQEAGNSASAAQQASQQAQEALAQAQRQHEQITALQRELRDSREQIDGLEQAFQLITDSGSELVLLNDIDHLLTIAQQQLQLGGNVANAIISLETAQAQLARANRPGLASLQQTINGDLDRLRAASTIDVALISSQLEEFSNLVSQAPLLVPDEAAPKPVEPEQSPSNAQTKPGASQGTEAPASTAQSPWWRQGLDTASAWATQAWRSVRQDLGDFIDVRRVDDASALLMSPDQATRFRDNLRLRTMTAQLALMMHQPGIWETETDALLQAVERRFDPKSAQTRQALKLARQFADTPIDVRVPTVDNSLQAIEVLREARDRKAQGESDQLDRTGEAPAESGDDATNGASPEAAPTPNSDEALPDTGAPEQGGPQSGADTPQPDAEAPKPESDVPQSGADVPESDDAAPQLPDSAPERVEGGSSARAPGSPVMAGSTASIGAAHARATVFSLNRS
ncbi:uroporphyrinogen-III C-methyltransferase [Allopusillimonas ginsengisoli]|uniref:uroporphyrinogen-III C-methyltransferase n=1 Tax=Allopusillimonas ginsengisoli TaxID=453575 RepID=UPI00101EEA66|nr:uroporphyrinogen-III C-methyltransferase [Allopusillimonas ginsengisoli]TEA77285.1 hypothetical protein ERE07_15130 [Allopusillimonas ginsengisoli]